MDHPYESLQVYAWFYKAVKKSWSQLTRLFLPKIEQIYSPGNVYEPLPMPLATCLLDFRDVLVFVTPRMLPRGYIA